jgi:hypothetical protein
MQKVPILTIFASGHDTVPPLPLEELLLVDEEVVPLPDEDAVVLLLDEALLDEVVLLLLDEVPLDEVLPPAPPVPLRSPTS